MAQLSVFGKMYRWRRWEQLTSRYHPLALHLHTLYFIIPSDAGLSHWPASACCRHVRWTLMA